MRRIIVVALARKLLIALWRYGAMALCSDWHGPARRHRDLNGDGRRFEFPRGSRPLGMPGGCVTELLLGLKTPLIKKGPVSRRATPAANEIGVRRRRWPGCRAG
jgi:hypothetical protein